MRIKVLTILLAIISLSASAQNLTLAELQNLCKLSNWETGAQTLNRKGWEYHDSKRGDTYEYSTITYAYDKDDYYDDRAAAWLNIYTFSKKVEKINYVATKTAHKNIMASLSSNGYKLIDNKIRNQSLTKTYSSQLFLLVVYTETQKHPYDNKTFEVNTFTLTRKGGIYDNDNGEKTIYDSNGNIESRFTLKDGKPNGKFYKYYEDGTIEYVITYVNGNRTGAFTLYNEDGIPTVSGSMLNGEKNGLITYYDEDGNKKEETTYKNGVPNGKSTSFYPDGKISAVATYANGKLNGSFSKKHENGKPEMAGSFLNGELDGLVTVYDSKGVKESEITYKNGVKDGKFTYYFPNGKIYKSGTYTDDELNGKYIEYSSMQELVAVDDYELVMQPDGDIIGFETGIYVNGEKDGYWEERYTKDGKNIILRYATYDDGTLNGPTKEFEDGGDIFVFCNYKDGELDGKYQVKGVFMDSTGILDVNEETLITITDGEYADNKKSGYWIYKNSMNQITSEGYYQNGNKHGEWKYYKSYTDGKDSQNDSFCMQISSIENYYNGQLHGKFIKYRDQNAYEMFSDSIEYIANYRNGELHGHYEEYSTDGTITNSGSFSFGKKDGQWIEIDSTDNTKWITNYTDGKYNGLRKQFDTKDRKMFSFNYYNSVLSGNQIKYDSFGNKMIENVFQNGEMQSQTEYENNSKILEFQLKTEDAAYLNSYFNGSLSEYFSNNDTSCIVTNYEFYISKNNLETPFFNSFRTCNKMKHGLYEVFDNQHRKIIEGQYLDDKPTDIWKYNFYDQNLFYTENKTNSNTPWHFYTITNEPYSGKFVRTENKNGKRYNAVYKIKKALIEEIIYSDITTGKTVFKEKFKDGLKKD
ncbi:MAG: hypothetical protein II937_06440 [Bacteroidales bacterium]|nr:hypothetical protein [Bacteroidales bacterium]